MTRGARREDGTRGRHLPDRGRVTDDTSAAIVGLTGRVGDRHHVRDRG